MRKADGAKSQEVYSEGAAIRLGLLSKPNATIRCGECNCTPAICMAAETAGDCIGCSQVASASAECCCWQAAHGLA